MSGRVVRAGQPVGGVFLTASAESSGRSTESGPDGSFRIDELPPGRIELRIFIPLRREPGTTLHLVIARGGAEVSVELPTGGEALR